MGKKTCLLAQVLVTLYKNRSHLGASFSFTSNKDMKGCGSILIGIYKYHHGKWETRMMMSGGDLEHSLSKRLPLISGGAITLIGMSTKGVLTLVTNGLDHYFPKSLIGQELSGHPTLFYTRSPKT
jgi:hypothetical protein